MDPNGAEIARRRVLAGMAQVDLARAADIDQGYLSRIENGRQRPGPRALKRLAGALFCSIADLLSESEPAA